MEVTNSIIIKDIPTSDTIVKVAQTQQGEVVGQVVAHKFGNNAKRYCNFRLPAFYQGTPCDCCTLTNSHIYIDDLGVNKNMRNQGIAKKLVYEIVKESKKQGCEGRVVLLAGCKDASPLPFYKKIGFVTDKTQLNKKLDEVLKYKLPFDKNIQEFMCLPKKVITKIVKSV